MKPKPQGKTKKMWLAVVSFQGEFWYSDGLFYSRTRAIERANLRRPLPTRVIAVYVPSPVRKGRK